MRVIKTLFFTALVLFSCNPKTDIQINSENFELIELGSGVYSCIHKFGGKAICNVGIVDNGEETIIFDSFLSPKVARELLNAIESLGLSPIKYVINSHFHNDHIRGNQVFPEEVKIISTSRTREIIEKEEPLQIAYEKENAPKRFLYYDSLYNAFNGDEQSREFQQILMWRPYYQILSNSHAEVKTRLPDMYVDSIRNLDGSNRTVQLITRGEGHSESDLIMYLPEDEILFSGDLIFNGCHPYVAHGNISKWKDWLGFMKSLDVSIIMPGHGQMGTDDLIDQMNDYLIDLERSANQLLENKMSVEELDSVIIPDNYKKWWFERFYKYNLSFALETVENTEE